MGNWTLVEKIKRTIAKLGGFYVVRVFWKVSKYKKSRARAIILNKDKSKILLVKNITYTSFHLPGGGIEVGESGQDAVVREVQEELGINITILYSLGRYVYQKTDKHVEIFVTQTTSTNFKMQWELDEAFWFPLTELPELRKTTRQTLRDFFAHHEPVSGIWEIED